ncbi:HAD family phosphatase [Clostridium bornimense]|uniref:HAD family hydrolase n=1 Tax=Clostridium bornimense TaxID=1216932 RepID=UPI001C11DE45|nr:HAD family phosphatase [Clostridium bornimense]MBU5317260.1 HAD family phosphatase [Clostridium bornimense]
MKVELVIFDMDGLMFDTEKVAKRAWKETGDKFQYKFEGEIFDRFLGRNIVAVRNEIIETYGEECPVDEIIKEVKYLENKIVDDEGLVVKEGLYDLLEHLKGINVKLAVATSSKRERATKLLTLAKIENEFDYIICGDEVTKSKPDPEIFLKVAEKLNCKPENCIVMEDSRQGIQAAKSAGMNPIMVPDLLDADEETAARLYKKIKHLGEAIEIIR